MNHQNQPVALIAAQELLSDMPMRNLVSKCIEAQSQVIELERKLDARVDENIAVSQQITAALAVLKTVIPVANGRDLLTVCECARVEILQLREKQKEIPF